MLWGRKPHTFKNIARRVANDLSTCSSTLTKIRWRYRSSQLEAQRGINGQGLAFETELQEAVPDLDEVRSLIGKVT